MYIFHVHYILGAEKEKNAEKVQYFERSFVESSTIETKNKDMLMRDFGISGDDKEEVEYSGNPTLEVEVQKKKGIDEADEIFHDAIALLNKVDDKKSIRKAYALFQQAWKMNHTEAGGIIAMAHVFGIHFKQNLQYAKELFVNLSAAGEPRAQAGLALLHSLGVVGFNRSLSKSLIYYTFGALGENPLGMMAMAYKNWQGSIHSPRVGFYVEWKRCRLFKELECPKVVKVPWCGIEKWQIA